MESKNNFESGFRVKNIFLVESIFNRVNEVVFKGFETSLNIHVNVSAKEKNIAVEEIVDYVQLYDEKEQVKIRVRMVGLFELVGESEIEDMEKFGRINGASIIFPYIREHISCLSQKAGIGPIFLPPINFAKAKKQ